MLMKVTITTEEAVEMFGIPKGTLNNLRSQRKGPKFFKVGKRVLYRPEDIKKWIEQHPVMTADAIEDEK